jgi:hypothetical protein
MMYRCPKAMENLLFENPAWAKIPSLKACWRSLAAHLGHGEAQESPVDEMPQPPRLRHLGQQESLAP